MTFTWEMKDHNVNTRTAPGCDAPFADTNRYTGPHTVQASELNLGWNYFACGVDNGFHCSEGGLQAHIYVVENLNQCPFAPH